MPNITLNFDHPLNVSVQVGDIAYFINPTTTTEPPREWATTTTPQKQGPQSGIIKIGEIYELDCCNNLPTYLNGGYIKCDMPQDLFNTYYDQIIDLTPGPPSFIMFSKDNKANMASLLGYYASAQFRNNSTDEAELFNVGVEVFESSK